MSLHYHRSQHCSLSVSLSSGSVFQTVELSDCERTQALALRVLLSLSKFNQHRIHEMDCYHGYSMIHQVLIKSKCIVGYHMLKVSNTLNSTRRLQPAACFDLHSFFVFFFLLKTKPDPAQCLSELVQVTPPILNPLTVYVIEQCDGCSLTWILADWMKR